MNIININSKLNVALIVPETLISEKNINLLRTTDLPKKFMCKNKKFLENNKIDIILPRNNLGRLSFSDYRKNICIKY